MNYRMYLEALGIPQSVINLSETVEIQVAARHKEIDEIASFNQLKVLKAMQDNRLSDAHFGWHTGYGYDDPGREAVEKIFAQVFGAEEAIVRPLIVNGTHALTLCLQGVLRPGDTMLAITGKPYDTLENVIGIAEGSQGMGTLKEFGIHYHGIELLEDGAIDLAAVQKYLRDDPKVKMVYLQRSGGYSWRKALTISMLEEAISVVRGIRPDVVVMVDNCYGEFLATKEPTEIGADLMAGSLIKNPGGGLALSGGYIAGKSEWVEKIAYRMTSPGIGKECGLTFGQTRAMLQGLFLAPTVVAAALKGAVFCSALYENLGFEVCPKWQDERSDIIQSIKLLSPEKVIAFCEGIQSAAPVDSYVAPVPWAMPGYTSEVIMAAGAFVQGSSIELSADAPIREPFIVYFQGGLTYDHSKFGALKSLARLIEKELIQLKSS